MASWVCHKVDLHYISDHLDNKARPTYFNALARKVRFGRHDNPVANLFHIRHILQKEARRNLQCLNFNISSESLAVQCPLPQSSMPLSSTLRQRPRWPACWYIATISITFSTYNHRLCVGCHYLRIIFFHKKPNYNNCHWMVVLCIFLDRGIG